MIALTHAAAVDKERWSAFGQYLCLRMDWKVLLNILMHISNLDNQGRFRSVACLRNSGSCCFFLGDLCVFQFAATTMFAQVGDSMRSDNVKGTSFCQVNSAARDFSVQTGALEASQKPLSRLFPGGVEFDDKLSILPASASLVVSADPGSLDCSDTAETEFVSDLPTLTLRVS